MPTEKIAKVQVTYYDDCNLLDTEDLELVEEPSTMTFTVPACDSRDAVSFVELKLVAFPHMKHPEVEFIGWQADDDVEAIEKRTNRSAFIFAFALMLVLALSFALQYAD